MRIILHPSRCPNSVLRACALRLFAGVGPPLRALFCCPAAPGGWNPGAKTGGTLLSRPFFGGCAGGAPDLSAAMTRPCLRDAGTYDFRTKWFLIFFSKKSQSPLFLPSCHLAARYPVARYPVARYPVARYPVARRLAARRLAARRLAARRPVTLPPCHLAALSPCRPLPCRPPLATPPSGRLARTAHAVSSPSPRSGENPPAVKLRFCMT